MADFSRHSIFCDWLTIRQTHLNPVPVINGGYVVSVRQDAYGKVFLPDQETGEGHWVSMFDGTKAQYTTHKRIEHEGSYETGIQIRSDGYTVELSGNVSRFGRSDNLFGLSVAECVEKANEIIQSIGLPPFSELDDQCPMAHHDSYNTPSTSARITRVDLTQNLFTGSKENAMRYIHAMAGQATMVRGGGNKIGKAYGNGCTWNEGSKRWYAKLYYKADELGKYASEEVKNLCESQGVVRYEVSLKARELADLGANRILPWCLMKGEKTMAEIIYGRFTEVLERSHVSTLDLSDIPGKLGLLASDYLNGGNPYGKAGCQRTAQRWRKQLLKYGVDIAVPLNVTRLSARVNVIELTPLTVPDWYSLESA